MRFVIGICACWKKINILNNKKKYSKKNEKIFVLNFSNIEKSGNAVKIFENTTNKQKISLEEFIPFCAAIAL